MIQVLQSHKTCGCCGYASLQPSYSMHQQAKRAFKESPAACGWCIHPQLWLP